jgi:hypothetical protein
MLSPTGDRGFESVSLQRGVSNELCVFGRMVPGRPLGLTGSITLRARRSVTSVVVKLWPLRATQWPTRIVAIDGNSHHGAAHRDPPVYLSSVGAPLSSLL